MRNQRNLRPVTSLGQSAAHSDHAQAMRAHALVTCEQASTCRPKSSGGCTPPWRSPRRAPLQLRERAARQSAVLAAQARQRELCRRIAPRRARARVRPSRPRAPRPAAAAMRDALPAGRLRGAGRRCAGGAGRLGAEPAYRAARGSEPCGTRGREPLLSAGALLGDGPLVRLLLFSRRML